MKGVPEITVFELRDELAKGKRLFLLDVRNPGEYTLCHLNESVLLPLPDLPSRLFELNPDDDIVVYCHSGVRSAHAAGVLSQAGFSNVRSLRGGIDAWALHVDPSMPRY